MKKDWMIKESELDDDQIKVLMSALDKSCIVKGCAGSGKSILALIKAQRIQKEKGNNYQIIVYTKALCNYMNSGREELGLRNNFLYHEEWKWKKYLKYYANGSSFMVYRRDENGNRILNMPQADFTIVDEIQDFSKEEINEFIKATSKNFFFFGDTAQSIYGGLKDTVAVEDIRFVLPNARFAKEWELFRNYRLPVPVAKFVQNVGIDLPPYEESTYKSIEKKIPYMIGYNLREQQLDAIHRIITRDNLDDVAILLPNHSSVIYCYNELTQRGGNYEMRYKDETNFRNNKDTLNFKSTNPKIMTYHSAKGLQFETVFIPFAEDLFGDGGSKQKSLYVALTRTYRNLYVLYSGNLPTPLSKIDRSLYKETEVEETKDI